MAIKGKGALRIAIEDFMLTNPVGKWVFSWYEDFVEGVEEGILTEFKPVLDLLESVPELKPYLNIQAIRAKVGKHQGAAIALGSIGVGIGSNAAASLLAPVMKLLNYQIDKQVHSMRFDPGLAHSIMWRNPSLKSDMENHLNCLGYNPIYNSILETVIRPKLDDNELGSAYLRGVISLSDYKNELLARGYTEDSINKRIELYKVIPSISDLISMSTREAWNENIASRFKYDEGLPLEAAAWAEKQGLSGDWFKRYWRSHWQLISPSQAFEMLHRLRPGTTDKPFTNEDMNSLLQTADYPEFFRERLVEISYSPYTRVDVRRMYLLGILNKDQVYNSYRDIGYDHEHAENLTTYTIEHQTSDNGDNIDEARSLNQSTIISAYKKQLISKEKAIQLLSDLKYSSESINIILQSADFAAYVNNVPDYKDTLITQYKNLLTDAYTNKLISKDIIFNGLKQIDLQEEDINSIIRNADFEYEKNVQAYSIKLIGNGYINNSLSYNDVLASLSKLGLSGELQNHLFTEWGIEKNNRNKQLSESQYRACVQKGLMTIFEYKNELEGMGYSDKNIRLLVGLYFSEEGK